MWLEVYFDTSSLFSNYKESFISNAFFANNLIVCIENDITYVFMQN